MYTQLTTETYKEAIAAVENGILLCHKKLCPHCKNMEKVMEKFGAQNPGVAFFHLDSEEEPDAMKELGAERVPTILIIKGGKVVTVKAGLMNPRELTALYKAAK